MSLWADSKMWILRGEYLGTVLHIEHVDFLGSSEIHLQIKAYLRAFEAKYSRFIPGNWLSDINSAGWWILDTPAREMLEVAMSLAKLTDGAFDPTITPDLENIGYGKLPLSISVWERTGYSDVDLRGNSLTLKNGVRIEFGGVGKGYALEYIARLLSDCPHYIINFGGDIFVRGWADIALENPLDRSEAIGTVHIEEWYICGSSGLYRQLRGGHHLIDGRTGKSSDLSLASWVVGWSGVWTDALATAVYILGPDAGIPFLESFWKNMEHAEPLQFFGGILSWDNFFHQSQGSQFEVFK